MRVLVANKFWYRRGGLERVMFDEIAWLEEVGHEVAHFSTRHPENVESPWAEYFAPYIELGVGADSSVKDKMRAAARMFVNRTARARFASLLDEFRPDLIHVHGIHRQISPSILFGAAGRGIPVVQTLHDYHHVCPADVLLKSGDRLCEPRECGTLSYWPAVAHRCVRGSCSASALSAAETAFQRIRGAYERTVRRFISPSAFLADAMKSGGWSTPCDVIPNAVPRLAGAAEGGDYALYAGRLAPEKGVGVFLEAARASGVSAVVAGTGPLADRLRESYPEAEFLGRVDGARVQALVCGSMACVVPSTWYENAPMSALEPMAAGIPVIASAIGGIPELIEDGVSGVLVKPGDVGQLTDALRRLAANPEWRASLGSAAQEVIGLRFSPERHLESLLRTYERAIRS